MEMKHMPPIKPWDILVFRELFNFLIKCQSLSKSSQNNTLDTPEMICMILSQVANSSPRQMEQEHIEDEKSAFQGTSAV